MIVIIGALCGIGLAVLAGTIGIARTTGLLIMSLAIPVGLVELPVRLVLWPFLKRFEMLYTASIFSAGFLLWLHQS